MQLYTKQLHFSYEITSQRCRKVMKSGGGNIFYYDLGGSGGMPPQKLFLVFSFSETASGAI